MIFLTAFYYLVITCLSVLCLWYADHRWKKRRLYSCSKNVPGPYCFPVIGAAYILLGDPSNLFNPLMKKLDSFSDIMKVWFANKLLYFLIKPEYIAKVISNPNALDKDPLYQPLTLATGDGLVTLGGTKWRRHRKLINPSFNQKILNSFLEVMSEKSGDLVKDLEKTVGNRNVPLYRIISRYTIEVTCQTAMGVDMNVKSIENNLDVVLDKIIELFTDRVLKVWYHLDIIWYLSGKKKAYHHYTSRLRNVINEVITKRMEDEKSKMAKTETGVATDDGNAAKRVAFLDTLLANADLDEKEIKDEVNTFIVAATETTANTLTAVFTILGIYPDIQEKVYKEIIDTIGVDGEPTPEDLNSMELTERVIKETLRMFPAAVLMGRQLTGDIDLGDNMIIPEGATVVIPLLHIHRSGELWEDPLKFDPNRFLPEKVAERHPSTYFGFSQGPRSCIGMRYAMMNMKLVIAMVVRRLRFFSEYKSVGEIEIKMAMFVKMKDGPKVWVENR